MALVIRMGEAKRRGSYEKRQKEGIAKNIAKREAEAKAREERLKAFIAHKPYKDVMAMSAILAVTGIGFNTKK